MQHIQDLQISSEQGYLVLKWLTIVECKNLSIQIAKDSEFRTEPRTFVTPGIQGVNLDVGLGDWYVRIGVWIGSDKRGTIEWSGIYGPIAVPSMKSSPPVRPSKFGILHTQSLEGGIRLHSGYINPAFAVMEFSKQNTFPASATTTNYAYDFANGYFDCDGLRAEDIYSVRIATLVGDVEKLPYDSIVMLGAWTTVHKKRAKAATKPHDLRDQTMRAADAVMLREAKEKQTLRFTTSSDYTAYLAAKTRNQDTMDRR
jgi:hypothetical protein